MNTTDLNTSLNRITALNDELTNLKAGVRSYVAFALNVEPYQVTVQHDGIKVQFRIPTKCIKKKPTRMSVEDYGALIDE